MPSIASHFQGSSCSSPYQPLPPLMLRETEAHLCPSNYSGQGLHPPAQPRAQGFPAEAGWSWVLWNKSLHPHGLTAGLSLSLVSWAFWVGHSISASTAQHPSPPLATSPVLHAEEPVEAVGNIGCNLFEVMCAHSSGQ